MKRLFFWLSCILLLMISLPAFALAIAPSPQPTLALPSVQIWTLAIGALVPIVTYVLNHYAPWCSEPVKAVVLVIAAAVAGGVYQAIDVGSVGFNTRTAELVLTSVIAAVGSHHLFWKPSGISAKLKAGTNVQNNPRR